VINVLVQAAFGYAQGGYQVIVDGIIGPWFPQPFRVAGHITGIPCTTWYYGRTSDHAALCHQP
jgi:hypothetical protein